MSKSALRAAGRRSGARRTATVVSSLAMAFVTTIAFATEAAAACANYGCDGHNPNIQTWKTGPKTAFGIGHPMGSLDLRVGVTGGDQYAWGRLYYPGGAGPAGVYVNRRNRGGGGEEWVLGWKAVNTDGWSGSAGTNTISTWSGMYYNPTWKQVQACMYMNNTNETYCTAWY